MGFIRELGTPSDECAMITKRSVDPKTGTLEVSFDHFNTFDTPLDVDDKKTKEPCKHEKISSGLVFDICDQCGKYIER